MESSDAEMCEDQLSPERPRLRMTEGDASGSGGAGGGSSGGATGMFAPVIDGHRNILKNLKSFWVLFKHSF